jgi:hypothetical protein
LSRVEYYAKMVLYVGVIWDCQEGAANGYSDIEKEMKGRLLSPAPH